MKGFWKGPLKVWKGPLLGQKLLKVDNYFGDLGRYKGPPLGPLSYEPKFK